ncbi:unnamed protein product [Prunus armeniaca]
MGGSLVKLYKSVENLSDTYIQPATNKDEALLKPTTLSAGANVLRILTDDDPKACRTVLLCDQLLNVLYLCLLIDTTYFVCAFASWGLKLVKASLESKTSLTNVFLGNDRFVCVELLCGRLMMQSPRSVLNIPSMATTSSASVSLKLLIDTKSHKVLFAEASKEVVDFLFNFLSLHVATVTRLLSTDGHPAQTQKTTISAANILQLPLPTNNDSSNIKAGYVKGGVIYMIMDNLEVKPMTTESNVAVLQKFNVKGIDALQVKEVDLGMQEGLKLVKASLESNTALTNVFLGKKQHKLFNFGPLETLSFWGFILVCGLRFLFYYSPY